jgi:hypothetical protein
VNLNSLPSWHQPEASAIGSLVVDQGIIMPSTVHYCFPVVVTAWFLALDMPVTMAIVVTGLPGPVMLDTAPK